MYHQLLNKHKKDTRGFTLLELLIVIAIIAILATILIIIINPVEMLRRARDVQRLSDMATLKTAIGLYMVDNPTADMDGQGNATCINVSSGDWSPTNGTVFYSYIGSISDDTVSGASNAESKFINTATDVDGSGWLPIDFGMLAGSSPISHLPLDPINTIANTSDVKYTDLVYRYACGSDPVSFEINARLESDTYTVEDPKMQSDGGNTDELYEIGTNLRILGRDALEEF